MTLEEIRAKLKIRDEGKENTPENPITYEQYTMWKQLKQPFQEVRTDVELVQGNKTYVSNALECPKCYGSNMHHISVETFSRFEDYTTGDHIKLIEHKSHGWQCLNVIPPDHSTDSDMKGNPSSRRTGISITFICEDCHAEIRLGIAQDRGRTELAWRHYK